MLVCPPATLHFPIQSVPGVPAMTSGMYLFSPLSFLLYLHHFQANIPPSGGEDDPIAPCLYPATDPQRN